MAVRKLVTDNSWAVSGGTWTSSTGGLPTAAGAGFGPGVGGGGVCIEGTQATCRVHVVRKLLGRLRQPAARSLGCPKSTQGRGSHHQRPKAHEIICLHTHVHPSRGKKF